ncbi:MAG: hypothetical protein A3F72_21465 [Bacteroidetes bacterium RIFCSPLOWO2_12_FULL_35_15]|nr:MAG: hypothetical protein A3F72_21465 [Bacteroidetes bacterium RIFCSPLOWO2_12_FULL_35_15]
MFILAGFGPFVQSEAQEYDLKAAYIFNITKFIYWDSTIPGNEFIIGVIDPSPIYEPLEKIAKTKTVMDKKIIIKQFTKLEEIDNCTILFIPKNTSFSLKEIVDKAKSKKILTISEHEGYGKKGSAINFVTIEEKLKFEVNTKTLESIGLKASAQFLKLAVIIE